MTTGLTYATYTTQIATMAVVDPTDVNFQAILPQAITYAENRIYRDLDLISTIKATYAYNLTVGSRSISIPESLFVESEQINVVTPLGAGSPDAGTRNPLMPCTKEFLDAVYGSSANAGVPQYFVPFNSTTLYVGPFPDAAYMVELVGAYRPDSLSATNPSTFVSTYLPDLMIQASMIYVSAYQRNFSSMGNDPQMPGAYEAQYQILLKGAAGEEWRKKFEAAAWSSKSASPVATPTRG